MCVDRDAESSVVEGKAEVEGFGRMILGPIDSKLVSKIFSPSVDAIVKM